MKSKENLSTGLARRQRAYPLLRQFGFPSGGGGEDALEALHAGAAYHAMAILFDVVEAYERSHAPHDFHVAYRDMLSAPCEGEDARVIAENYYSSAIALCPELAEAHFNLARLHWDRGQLAGAEEGYRKVIGMKAHDRAQPHAYLIANAHWNLGEVLEVRGHEPEALNAYDCAVAIMANFGVHHARYAKLLRKHGRSEEAMEQFNMTMAFSHRYFPEFVLPHLKERVAAPVGDDVLESLMRLSNGDHVIFWGGSYYAVPPQSYPITGELLASQPAQDVKFSPYPSISSDSLPSSLGLARLWRWAGAVRASRGSNIRISDVMMNLEQNR